VRKAWVSPVLILIAVVMQLTLLNGLRLPGGGVPDLVLVLVAALAEAQGPLAGLITGFAAGLCLDLAPPGSALIGQYALVFCLAGWAAGRLASAAGRSPLRSALLMGAVVAAAEAASATLGLALVPAEVTLAEVRAILPSSIVYDLLLCPFVMYLVVLAIARPAGSLAAGTLGGTLGTTVQARRAADRKPRPLQPRLREAAARTGDGWVGSAPLGHPGARAAARPGVRLRSANGVPGSASGLARLPRHPGRARRRPGRHPGILAGQSGFRPHGGQPGGSATRTYRQVRAPQGPPAIRFSARRPHGAARAPERQPAIRFGGHRGDASVGRALGSGWRAVAGRPVSSGPRPGSGWLAASGRPVSPGPQLRMGARRSARAGGRSAAAVPKVAFRSAGPPAARRPAAVPRFRRKSPRLRPSTTASGLISGGVLDASTFRAVRRRAGAPRLRLASRGRATGMLGGSPGSALRRLPRRVRKQPRFGYGKRSLLSFPAVKRIGGRWLARNRAGSRSGTWLIGKRTGGVR
jgi:rod shape-determining protein MreD